MSYFMDESGAVTVDWVVLTAGLVGLGLATMAVVSGGVEDLTTDTKDELDRTFICTNFTTCTDREFWHKTLAYVAASGEAITQDSLADEIRNIEEKEDYYLARQVYHPNDELQSLVDTAALMETYDGSPAAQDALAQIFGAADAAELQSWLPADGMETVDDVAEVFGTRAEFYLHYHGYAVAEADRRGLTAEDGLVENAPWNQNKDSGGGVPEVNQ